MLRQEYKDKALSARRWVLKMVYDAQSSHIGSLFSCIDILTVLYDIANIDAALKPERDRVVISKGWAAAAVYYFLADKGIIPEEDLATYCKPDSPYIGLLEPSVRGVEAAGGSMGLGLPFAIGFALAKKIKKESGKVFCLMSDGEQNIGTTWESALIGAHHKLDNLVVIIDQNRLQAMGDTTDILQMDSLRAKWESFNWEVRTVDGHDHIELKKALTYPALVPGRPIVVIAETLKGKGVPLFEGDNKWHYLNLSPEDYKTATETLYA